MVMQAQFDPFRITKFGVGFDSMLNQITSDFFTDSFHIGQFFLASPLDFLYPAKMG